VRGLAHIGVIKGLDEAGIRPIVITGTSAGSIIGAALAAGMGWRELAAMAQSVFWPSLLIGERLESFCARHLPKNFESLQLPFAAIATQLPSKLPIAITEGCLSSAISASCAIRLLRRPVLRNGQQLKDGGITCVLPSSACRDLGADFIIGSDVWEFSSLVRRVLLNRQHRLASSIYPSHFRGALATTDLLIQPDIPMTGYYPGPSAITRMISAGERAVHRALAQLQTW
jgi:predicted acylesterase/phospholipase RssA